MDGLQLDKETAVQQVISQALLVDGLISGIRQCVRFIEQKKALFCILADNCDDSNYTNLIKALCNEHRVPLINTEDNKKLGEMAGHCKTDKEGKARKVITTSCVVINKVPEGSAAYDYLKTHSGA
ncbi:40S ribosomal protein S12 [Cichlidogyrus casuarinus]|uniref:40S ribosomal protein S12 n=1 Tax=Cichlidogyrus casuarinus TaxID=1844966 RepID=A0ABD2QEB2_9PLAT